MSKSKDKKIAQIKNRKIWPFVVAIVVIILVFTGMSVALLGTGYTNLVMTKAQTLHQMVEGVEDRYVECQQSGEDFSEAIYKYMPDVRSICIVDENNQLLQQYGNSKPDFNRMRQAGGQPDPSEPGSAQSDALWTDNKIETVTGQSSQISGRETYVVYCGYVRPLSDSTQKLCVKLAFTFYQYELMSIVITVLVFFAFMLLLIGWNIYMIVRVVRGADGKRIFFIPVPLPEDPISSILRIWQLCC